MLRPSERTAIFYPTWNRTVDEFSEPLASGSLAEALGVEEYRKDSIDDSVTYPQFRERGDARAFAEAYLPFVRAITANPFFRWLEPDRPREERHGGSACGGRGRVPESPVAPGLAR